MYNITFEINELPPTTNSQTGMHWSKKGREKKRWHFMVWQMVGSNKPKQPLKRAKLTLERFSSVRCDFDNLVISFKNVIDGLTECGVLEDDKYENIGQPTYIPVKCEPKRGKIRVTVEELRE